jgi:hypothetical protein
MIMYYIVPPVLSFLINEMFRLFVSIIRHIEVTSQNTYQRGGPLNIFYRNTLLYVLIVFYYHNPRKIVFLCNSLIKISR